MTHEEEQKNLFLDYLYKHIFFYWKEENLRYHSSLELIVTPTCNTACTYCYYNNFAKKYLYTDNINCKETIIQNCEKVMKWVKNENFRPESFEIFSGEFINLPYCNEILEIIDKSAYKDALVVIPTNGTFCRSEETLKKAQDILDKYNCDRENHNIRVVYSLSVDGKYLDNDTRPMKNGVQYDDAFYDRLFKFAVKNDLMFHPMVGAKGIEKWIDNYEWYIENVMKYFQCTEEEAFSRVYLLEVRNPDWTPENCKDLEKFIEYLVDKTFKAYGENLKKYFKVFLGESRGFNFFSGVLNNIQRGLGCSIQQSLAIRLGDLSLVPCHRTAYKGYEACYFKFDENNKLDIDIVNPNMYMFIQSFDAKNGILCSDCPISSLCGSYCLGANYEVNKDFFIPVKSVCLMEYCKVKAIIEAFDKRGILNLLLRQGLSRSKRIQVENLINIIKGDKQ